MCSQHWPRPYILTEESFLALTESVFKGSVRYQAEEVKEAGRADASSEDAVTHIIVENICLKKTVAIEIVQILKYYTNT